MCLNNQRTNQKPQQQQKQHKGAALTQVADTAPSLYTPALIIGAVVGGVGGSVGSPGVPRSPLLVTGKIATCSQHSTTV